MQISRSRWEWVRQISEWRHAPTPRAAHTRVSLFKTDFCFPESALHYNFGFARFISFFFSIRVFPSILCAEKLFTREELRMLCRSITYVIFSFLCDLTKFMLFFLLRYIGCNKARNKDRRYQPDEEIIDETDFLVLYPAVCSNSYQNRLSNCFPFSLMSYSYRRRRRGIASVSYWHQ